MSVSFPYFSTARRRRLSYGAVLAAVENLEEGGAFDVPGIDREDLLAILRAFNGEQDRRREACAPSS